MVELPAHRWSLVAAVLWLFSTVVLAEQYTVPLFVPASTPGGPQGVLSILNVGDASSTVTVYGIDDAGTRFGPATFALGAWAAAEFDAADLANGNAGKGLTGSLGTGTGEWRLEIDTDLPIEPLAYVRAPDGTLSVMHDTVRGTEVAGRSIYRVAIFNPSTDASQSSRLRLINPDDAVATVTIGGRDDTGAAASGGEVKLTVPANGARTLTAQQLEAGDASLAGRLGAGVGRWRLSVSADRPIRVVNVAVTSAGAWNNLSTTAVRGPAPADQSSFNERFDGLNVVYETDSGRFTLSPQAGERFTEVGEADGLIVRRSGTYGYSHIGPDAGRFTLEYDDGNACAANFYFASRVGGWFASHCTGADHPDGRWLGGVWYVDDGVDTSPAFAGEGTGEQIYRTGIAIDALTLPVASGGDRPLGYSLSPDVPGLSFDAERRELSGTPTEADSYAMTYTVTDADGDTDTLDFTINVVASDAVAEGNCYVGLIVRIEERCTYPGTEDEFSVNVRGRGRFLDRLAGIRIRIDNETIDGRVYDFQASHQGDGEWRIDRVAGRTEPPTGGGDGMDTGTGGDMDTGTGSGAVSDPTSYGTGAVIPNLPVGNWIPDDTSDATAIFGDGDIVIEFSQGGYIEEGAFRYTCAGVDGCVINNRTVLSGPVIQTPLTDAQDEHALPLIMSASNDAQQGFVRVVNRSASAGSIHVVAIDDAGREFGPVELAIDGNATVNFSSQDLESGNPCKGLSHGVGPGSGDWRLLLSTSLDIQPTSYVRTLDGFVSLMQELSRKTTANGRHSGYHVPTFNPASERNLQGRLRLINTSDRRLEVAVAGVDDRGVPAPGGEVRVALLPRESRSVTSWELEHGAEGLHGALGDGQGLWRLLLSAEPEVLVMSLLENSSGHLTNLSRGGTNDALDVDNPEVYPRHSIPLFPSASGGVRDGLLRIINHSESAGDVLIRAVDDSGRSFGPVEFVLNGQASVQFNSEDLEQGNPGKGLPLGVGDGQGDWRLELVSEMPIEALAYVRTADGFVTNVQDVSYDNGDVPMFSAGNDTSERSSLRLVNTLDRSVDITIDGIDDRGQPSPGGVVRLTLTAGEARTLSARQLETGDEGLLGKLGDGSGRWRLSVSTPQGVMIMSLLESSTGYLSNVSGGAHAEPLRRSDADGDGVSDYDDAFPNDPTRQQPIDGISTTLHDQIIVELRDEDTASPSLFDLNGKTVLFQRLGETGYARSVAPLAWESDIGSEVGDEAVRFQSFAFPFAQSDWDAFHVNVNGNITLGEALGRPKLEHRFADLRQLGDAFTKGFSTVAALYKRSLRGKRFVNRLSDRVVVTWEVGDSYIGVQGFSLSPTTNEFQAVLFADGSIAFNYKDVSVHDGIVGLFPSTEPIRGDRLATLFDPVDPDLPAHLDLTEVTVFDTDSDSLIVEFTMRGSVPDIGDTRVEGLHYSLYLDIDEPLVDRIDFQDADYLWRISGDAEHRYTMSGEGALAVRVDNEGAQGRISLVVSIPELEGRAVAAFADAFERVDGETKTVAVDQATPVEFVLPEFAGNEVDLSLDDVQQLKGYEAFHFRSRPDRFDLTCRVIQNLGDGFDFIFYHAEYRSDQQEAGSPMSRLDGRIAEGLGIHDGHNPARFCTEGKLLGILNRPIYMNSNQGRGFGPSGASSDFDFALSQLGHEMTHVWTVGAAYLRDGERVPLTDDLCGCHWRWELHVPAVFPWRQRQLSSTMGGGYWEDNLDGTFTQVHHGFFVPASGFSHLDLYLMGLFGANEVPDTWLLRDPQSLNVSDGTPVYSGRKERIAVDQVIAALGPRIPAVTDSQKTFNVGFVYLVEPGRSPTSLPLRRHVAMRDMFVEYWAHVTGERSQITTEVNFDSTVGFGRSQMEVESNVPEFFELLH